MSRQTTRRRFVVTAGAIGTGLLAGCTGENGNGGSDAEEGSDGMSTEEMTDENMTEEGMTDESMTEEEMTDDGMTGGTPTDPMSSPRAEIDRFSEDAGTLMVRTADNDLPGPNEAIDFDQAPFITRGLGPDGEATRYYNFDAQPTTPAPIYVLVREGVDEPVDGQLNIIDAIPGDEGYNDFWHVHRVTVPEGYEANTATSLHDIQEAGYTMEATDTLVNCPVVPDGSTASMRFGEGDAGLVEGWYRHQVVTYFQFTEASLTVNNDSVPLSPIYVTFNVNPGEDGGGPASGFMAEEGSDQTHNVLATLPGDEGYSPLWLVNIYDNADFEAVSDLDSATDATVLSSGDVNVNCPVVSVM